MPFAEITIQQGVDWSTIPSGTRDGGIRLEVGFVDKNGLPTAIKATSPTPQITITQARTGAAIVSAATMVVSGLPTGHASYDFWSTDWEAGRYTIRATAQLADNTPVTLEAAFDLFAPTVEETVALRVRSRLKDLDPALYKLDLPIPKWNLEEITYNLQDAIMDLNNSGPMNTQYTLDNCPALQLCVEYAFSKACQSQAVLENFNTMTLSDGSANLNINRAAFFLQLSQNSFANYQQQLKDWKRSLRPRLKGQGTSLFPYQIRRAIGFLPNMKQVFG